MKIALDTNILLRFIHSKDPMHRDVRSAVRLLYKAGDQLCFFPQNAAEFWNVCTRPSSARGGLGLSFDATKRQLRRLESFSQCFPDTTAMYDRWKTLVISHHVKGVQVYDAKLVGAMLEHGVGHLLTYNTADFKRYSSITVWSPLDVMANFSKPKRP